MNTNVKLEAVKIDVSADLTVSGSIGTPEWWPSGQRLGIVIAHDADSSIAQEDLQILQRSLAELGHLTLLFNFPYAEQDRKRPDPPALLEKTFRAAAVRLLADPENAPARMIVAGVGLGARITSQVVAQGMKVDGLICLGFPLHPAGKPNQQKVDALYRIICPMLFVQGSRDTHCRVDRLEMLLRRIGAPTRLHVVSDAGQGLALIKRTTRTQEDVSREIVDAMESFIQTVMGTT